ncbi:MAG: GNAT family N-acetyltransferase [Steroidobacteraceae bacterium]
MKIEVHEMKSSRIGEYRSFLGEGLARDEQHFRISPSDDAAAPFPTQDKEDSFTLAAYVDGALAGVVSFERDGKTREKLRHKGILFRMYVNGDFRGCGLGKRLIGEALSRAVRLGDIERINLTVVSDNAAAKALYESFGFATFGIEPNAIKWNGKYFAEVSMGLELRK